MPANSACPSSRRPRRNEGGFSVLELMVALLLFSALGIAVWSGLAGGQNLVSRSIRTAAGTSRLLQMESYLRREAALVQTPFWAPGPGAERAAGNLRVPWLNGNPAQTLQLSWGEGRLQVSAGEGEPGALFGPFASVDCAVYSDGPDGSSGLKVSVVVGAGDREPLLILAPFGGSPFSPFAPRSRP
jgi:type II secretory pathway pseudopilin PulG